MKLLEVFICFALPFGIGVFVLFQSVRDWCIVFILTLWPFPKCRHGLHTDMKCPHCRDANQYAGIDKPDTR